VINRQVNFWLLATAMSAAVILCLFDGSPLFARKVSVACLKADAATMSLCSEFVRIQGTVTAEVATRHVARGTSGISGELPGWLDLLASTALQRLRAWKSYSLLASNGATVNCLGSFFAFGTVGCVEARFTALTAQALCAPFLSDSRRVLSVSLKADRTSAPSFEVGHKSTPHTQSLCNPCVPTARNAGGVLAVVLFAVSLAAALAVLGILHLASSAADVAWNIPFATAGCTDSRGSPATPPSTPVGFLIPGRSLLGLLRSGLVLTLIGSHDALSSRDSGCGEDPSGRANAYPGPFVLHSKWHSGKLGNVADEATAVLTVGTSDRAGVLI
jgi:hypothetical protein